MQDATSIFDFPDERPLVVVLSHVENIFELVRLRAVCTRFAKIITHRLPSGLFQRRMHNRCRLFEYSKRLDAEVAKRQLPKANDRISLANMEEWCRVGFMFKAPSFEMLEKGKTFNISFTGEKLPPVPDSIQVLHFSAATARALPTNLISAFISNVPSHFVFRSDKIRELHLYLPEPEIKFSQMPNLESLCLYFPKGKVDLSMCDKLEMLKINAPAQDFFIIYPPNLKYLHSCRSGVREAPYLPNLVYANFLQSKQLEDIRHLEHVKYVVLNGCTALEDFSPLGKQLYIDLTGLSLTTTDLSLFASVPRLILRRCKLGEADISPLQNVRHLCLASSDVERVSSLTNVRSLDLQRCRHVSDYQTLKANASPTTRVYSGPADLDRPWDVFAAQTAR